MTDDIIEGINGELHVWWSYLDQPAEDTEKCHEILSKLQRARISRYKTAQLRSRQTVSDGSLASLVAGYLNEDPGQWSYNLPNSESRFSIAPRAALICS